MFQMQRRNGINEFPVVFHQPPLAAGIQSRQPREVHHAQAIGEGGNVAGCRFQHPGKVLVRRMRKYRKHRGQSSGHPRCTEAGAVPDIRRCIGYPDTGTGNRIATGRINMADDFAPVVDSVSGDVDDLVGLHRSFDTRGISGTDRKRVRFFVSRAMDDEEIECIAVLCHHVTGVRSDGEGHDLDARIVKLPLEPGIGVSRRDR